MQENSVRKKTIVVTGGGTGGHIYPNISVIEELRSRGIRDIVWIGQRGGKEQYRAQEIGVSFYSICTGKLRRYFSMKNFSDLFRVVVGFVQSFFLLSRLRPALLFSKGGFVSVAPVAAAFLLGIPVVTHESDIIPGLATRIIVPLASAVCVSFAATEKSFSKKKTFYTGNPLRGLIKGGDRERGIAFLGFKERLPIVLVIGGSLGASSLNETLWEMCRAFPLPFNLVHQCGRGNVKEGIGQEERYKQFDFIGDEMGDLLAASDIVVSRAGAGALYEIGCMKKPAILVPLPKTKSRGEQIENARFFSESGAAIVINDEELTAKTLFDVTNALLCDSSRLNSMGEMAERLCKNHAEKAIADIIEDLAQF